MIPFSRYTFILILSCWGICTYSNQQPNNKEQTRWYSTWYYKAVAGIKSLWNTRNRKDQNSSSTAQTDSSKTNSDNSNAVPSAPPLSDDCPTPANRSTVNSLTAKNPSSSSESNQIRSSITKNDLQTKRDQLQPTSSKEQIKITPENEDNLSAIIQREMKERRKHIEDDNNNENDVERDPGEWDDL